MFRTSNFSNRKLIRSALAASVAALFSSNLSAANVSLAWDASTSSGVGGYKLYYGQTSKNYSSSVDVGKVTSYQVAGLADGATYYFAVKAYNTARTVESSASNEISAATPSLTSPKPAPAPVTTAPAPTPAPVSATPAIPGLVAAYRFDESGGSTVADASGMGNNGVIVEAARTTGRFNNSLKFDGINDYVTIPDNNSLDLTTGMTLEAWVNPAASPTGWQNVLFKEQVKQQIYSLNASSSKNTPAVVSYISGGERPVYGGSQLLSAKWTHLAATYDGATQRLYVDGVQVAAQAQTGPILTSAGALRIGGNLVWPEWFKGLIDEVRIYNRALSATQIQKDMTTAIAVSNPTKPVLGQNQLEPFTDKVPAGVAVAYRVVPQKAAVVTEVNVYLNAAAPELAAGIYSDTNGHPRTRMMHGVVSNAKAGTNAVSIAAMTVEAGKPYWIVVLGPKSELSFRDRKGTAAVPMERNGATGLAALPSQWTVGTAAPTDGPMSAYGAGY